MNIEICKNCKCFVYFIVLKEKPVCSCCNESYIKEEFYCNCDENPLQNLVSKICFGKEMIDRYVLRRNGNFERSFSKKPGIWKLFFKNRYIKKKFEEDKNIPKDCCYRMEQELSLIYEKGEKK